jgi:hypothetical protein
MAYPEDTMEQLAVEPPEEDMEWVYANARRRKLSWVTAVLALGAAAAIGFAVGVRVQKSQVTTTSASAAASRRAGAATGGAAANPAAGAGAGRTIGTVKLIDGTNLYITDASGNVVKVSTTGASFTKTVSGAVTDVHPGDTVVVTGAAGSDGTVSARSVVLGGAGAAGGFGGGRNRTGTGGAATGGAAPPGG